MQKGEKRLPAWFKVNLTIKPGYRHVSEAVHTKRLHTVCQSASCPNRMECWNSGTATFMILGDVCTRTCLFCNVNNGLPKEIDPSEPTRIAETVRSLDLSYAVVTSVTRDDLLDGGASIFRDTILAIKKTSPWCSVEVLIPDFRGSSDSLQTVINAAPDVLSHNIETVPSLYRRIRPQADYHRSLRLLREAGKAGAVTKSGLMLGLGETMEDVRYVMRDLLDAGCRILAIGQYLSPSRRHILVSKYYSPEEFKAIEEEALDMGFTHVASGPRVRSSYRAHEYGPKG